MSKLKPDADLKNFVARIREVSSDVRERLGEDLYGLPTVAEQMSKEAVKGCSSLTITPPLPVDLRATKAAISLEKRLTAVGVRCEWHARFPYLDKGDGAPLQELVITW